MSKRLCKHIEDRYIIGSFLLSNKMKIGELAELLGTSVSTMYDWLHTGPQNPMLVRYALRALQEELNNNKQERGVS